MIFKKLYVPKISPKVLENNNQALKAIAGITVLLGSIYNKNASIMTEGIIPLVNSTTETFDLD